MKVIISRSPKQQMLSFSLKQLFAVWLLFITSVRSYGAVMELLGRNEFKAPLCHMRILMPKFFCLLTPVRENLISVEGDDFMGHIRLPVQGQGLDLSRASRILAWTLRGGGVFGWPQRHRQEEDHSLGVYLPVTTSTSDIILILDRCTVYSTRIACHRIGISCTLRLFELVRSQCL